MTQLNTEQTNENNRLKAEIERLEEMLQEEIGPISKKWINKEIAELKKLIQEPKTQTK